MGELDDKPSPLDYCLVLGITLLFIYIIVDISGNVDTALMRGGPKHCPTTQLFEEGGRTDYYLFC